MLKYYEPINLRTLSFDIKRNVYISYDSKYTMTFETVKEKELFELFISKVKTKHFYLYELIEFYKFIMVKKKNDISFKDVISKGIYKVDEMYKHVPKKEIKTTDIENFKEFFNKLKEIPLTSKRYRSEISCSESLDILTNLFELRKYIKW